MVNGAVLEYIYKNKQKLKFKIAINHVNKKVMQLADKK